MAAIDRLGPFSCAQLDEISAEMRKARPDFRRPLCVRALEASKQPADVLERLRGGQAVILLWRESPEWGHFIALVPRTLKNGGRSLELFDPLGGGHGADEAARYVQGERFALNGEGGWIARVLDAWARNGGEVSFNVAGPQSQHQNSCGAWCLMRALHSHMSPSDFRSQFLPA